MSQNKKVLIVIALLLGLGLAGATIAGTYIGVAQLSFLVTDSSGILAIAGVVIVAAVIALTKPIIFKWLLTAVGVFVLLSAVYGAFLSENSEYQFLGGMLLFGGVLALIGSALQWHNAKLAESPSYQNVWGMNLVIILVSFAVGSYFNSLTAGFVAFNVLWFVVIGLSIVARKAKSGIENKLKRN